MCAKLEEHQAIAKNEIRSNGLVCAINNFRSSSYENKTKARRTLGRKKRIRWNEVWQVQRLQSGEGQTLGALGRMCSVYNYIIASATGRGAVCGFWRAEGPGRIERGDRPIQGPRLLAK